MPLHRARSPPVNRVDTLHRTVYDGLPQRGHFRLISFPVHLAAALAEYATVLQTEFGCDVRRDVVLSLWTEVVLYGGEEKV